MMPRILLVEDDPTTAEFLATAARALPAIVDTVATRAAARAQAANVAYGLWLVDAHLPDGDGAGLLADLRGLGLTTPAIAHTAARDAWVHQQLHDAGFDAVLVKPLDAAALRAAVAGALAECRSPRIAEAGPARHAANDALASSTAAAGHADDATLPAWDDARALRALNGQLAHVDALRQLFLAELPAAQALVAAAAREGDHDAMRAALHRLQASCGFVGAARLQRAVQALQHAPACGDALAVFEARVQELSPPS